MPDATIADRTSDADGLLDAATLDVDRCRSCGTESLRGLLRLGERRLGQHDRELVATEARDHVARSDPVQQTPQHGLEDEVTDVVPVRVVDALEPVEVDGEQHRQSARCRLEFVDASPEGGAARRSREVVVIGCELECLALGAPIGHVGVREQHDAVG